MKKGSGRKKVLAIVIACLAVLVVFAVFFSIDYSNSHDVIWLGKYKGLTVSADGAESPEAALVGVIVQRTKFGRALDQKMDERFDKTWKYFVDEATYFQMSFDAYLTTYYKTDEESFRKVVRESAEASVREEAVLLAIAERESITVTDEEFDSALPGLMEAAGYTDEIAFSRSVNYEDLRKQMLMERVTEFLMKENTVQ